MKTQRKGVSFVEGKEGGGARDSDNDRSAMHVCASLKGGAKDSNRREHKKGL